MSTSEEPRLAGAAAPVDVLLVDAALGPVRGFAPDVSTAKWALSLAREPRTTQGGWAVSAPKQSRSWPAAPTSHGGAVTDGYKDKGWTDNPLLHRLLQLYVETLWTDEPWIQGCVNARGPGTLHTLVAGAHPVNR